MNKAYVLVVRHPDDANAITTDGDVRVIDIDLGSSFVGRPHDEEQAISWAHSVLGELDEVPLDSPVYVEALSVIAQTVGEYDKADELVEDYDRLRREKA